MILLSHNGESAVFQQQHALRNKYLISSAPYKNTLTCMGAKNPGLYSNQIIQTKPTQLVPFDISILQLLNLYG